MDKTELLINTGKFVLISPQSLPMHFEIKAEIPLYINRIRKRLEDAIYE